MCPTDSDTSIERPLWGRGCIGLEKVDTLRHRGIEVRFPAGTRAALPTLHVELGQQRGLEARRHGVLV